MPRLTSIDPDRTARRGPARPRRTEGFTLLEVMVALAFVALALIAVIRAQGRGIALTDEARFLAKASFLAKALLSDAEHLSDLPTGSSTGRFEEPHEGFAWRRDVTPMPFLAGLYRVRVYVHRPDRSATEGVSLEGFVYRGPS